MGVSPSGVPNALLPNQQQPQVQVQQPQDQKAQQSDDDSDNEDDESDQSSQFAQPQQTAPAQAATPSAQMSDSMATAAAEQAPQDQQQQDIYSLAKRQRDDFQNEANTFSQDLYQGRITPKQYKDVMGQNIFGKIGSIFAYMLSGAASGLTHQPNVLLEMMNNEIKNDIDAQVKSKENAQNLYRIHLADELQKANLEQLRKQGTLTDAQAALAKNEANLKAITSTQLSMNIAGAHHLADAVQKLPPGSPERAKAEQALAMVYMGLNAENSNIIDRAAAGSAYMKMLMGNQSGEPKSEEQFKQETNRMRMLGPQGVERAKDIESKHFPGIQGQASVPLSESDREGLNSGITFDQKLNRFIDWTRSHSGDLSISDRKQGQAMAAELQGAYRQATHGGVYKEGEQNFISKLIDSTPTKFFNEIRVIPQLEAISQENRSRVDQLAKSKGFNGYIPEQKNTSGSGTIELLDPRNGKKAVYDAKTKNFIGWK